MLFTTLEPKNQHARPHTSCTMWNLHHASNDEKKITNECGSRVHSINRTSAGILCINCSSSDDTHSHFFFCHPNIRTCKQLSGHVHILHHQGSRSTAQSSLDQSLPDVGHWMCFTPHTIYLLTSETRRRIISTHPRHLWNKDSSLLHHSSPIGQPYDAVPILH